MLEGGGDGMVSWWTQQDVRGEEASVVGRKEELELAEKSMRWMQIPFYSCNSQGRGQPAWVSAKTD